MTTKQSDDGANGVEDYPVPGIQLGTRRLLIGERLLRGEKSILSRLDAVMGENPTLRRFLEGKGGLKAYIASIYEAENAWYDIWNFDILQLLLDSTFTQVSLSIVFRQLTDEAIAMKSLLQDGVIPAINEVRDTLYQ